MNYNMASIIWNFSFRTGQGCLAEVCYIVHRTFKALTFTFPLVEYNRIGIDAADDSGSNLEFPRERGNIFFI